MKKRFLVLIALVIIMCFAAAGCDIFGGRSAYEIACDNGFVGTETEWLESLKGRDGQDASSLSVEELFTAYLLENPDATFTEFLETLSAPVISNEYAAAIGMRSAVSVYSSFTRKQTSQGQSTEYSSAGSGVVYKIIDDYAYIITNYHVVYDRDSTVANGIATVIDLYCYGLETSSKGVSAQFVGGSISKDIAIVKAPLSDFPTTIVGVTVGDSNHLTLGESVIAIGNPSAEGISVSVGALSVDSEDIEMEALDSATQTVFMRVIRTDAAINKGNSGGGLFNSRGQLVGIVNAKTIESGVENIGYAIPSVVAAGIADSVIENDGKKCLLGITISVLWTQTAYNSKTNRVEITQTVSVESVSPNSLAMGKILEGDKLLSVSLGETEMKITRLFHLSDFLYNVREGDTLFLTVERGGLEVVLELSSSSSNFTAV